jgi:hypothetical protein
MLNLDLALQDPLALSLVALPFIFLHPTVSISFCHVEWAPIFLVLAHYTFTDCTEAVGIIA